MRYEITNWGGKTMFVTDDRSRATEWLTHNGIVGDALWDNESDSEDPVTEVYH